MNDYTDLEKQIEIKFENEELITKAFTHKSYINENRDKGMMHNERLEFLGDAVLELAATEHLFHKYPDQDEGQMTSFRSALVKGKHLAEVAKELNLGKYLFLSKGEEKSGGRTKNYILANTVESLIGAIYLEYGYDDSKRFIKQFILKRLDDIIDQGLHIDAKSRFQELAQEKLGITPHYEVLSEAGPDHDKKFKMGAYIGEELVAEGVHSSKQNAEQVAAENALVKKEWA